MALTIEQTQRSASKRKAKASPKARKSATAAQGRRSASARTKASVRRSVKPWSQASMNLGAEGLQKWMDRVIDKVFEQPMPAFIDKADIKKRSEQIIEIVERGQTRVQQIREKNPVLNELIEVAQKQLKKAQNIVTRK